MEWKDFDDEGGENQSSIAINALVHKDMQFWVFFKLCNKTKQSNRVFDC